MDSVPTRKISGDLRTLKKVDWKDVQSGKVYYIRVRNKDVSEDVWGLKEDYIGKINHIDKDGISFDYIFHRYADPRHGAPTWRKKKEESRVLILTEGLTKKNLADNTTFYIDTKTSNPKGGITRRLKRLFDF